MLERKRSKARALRSSEGEVESVEAAIDDGRERWRDGGRDSESKSERWRDGGRESERGQNRERAEHVECVHTCICERYYRNQKKNEKQNGCSYTSICRLQQS